jgi:hypothetical protein
VSRRRISAFVAALVLASAAPVLLPASSASAAACSSYPSWVAGKSYVTGNIVRYTDGKAYIAEHDNPGYDPTISTWFWEPYACDGGSGNPSGFVVSEAQFNQMFPGRNSFYTYSGLKAAMSAYPAFANTGSDTVKKQEAAAFLANVSHETGGLVHIVEQNTANYPHYCDWSQPYGCPAGQAAYYGRGPIQLSWNFNYKAAGDALGIDLLNNPCLLRPERHDRAQRGRQGGSGGAAQPQGQRGPPAVEPPASGSSYVLESTDTAGSCLGRSGGQARTVACTSADAAWQITPTGGDQYTLKVPGAESYLTVAAKPSGANYPAQLAIGSSGGLASWYLTPITSPTKPMPAQDQRTLDQVTFLTAHNAYANGVDGGFAPPFVNFFPNQSAASTSNSPTAYGGSCWTSTRPPTARSSATTAAPWSAARSP